MIINGTSSKDELYTNQDNQVFGFEGDDTLDASNGKGNNLLDGGSGNDRLFGNNNDTLRGGVGADSLFAVGSSGFNTLEGGEDDDELVVVEGSNNKLDGGLGNDELTVSDGSGYNTLLGGLGNDFLNVSNETGNNSLDGGENDDVLIGGLASDRLFGGSGDDSLYGGTKGSQLTGGTGEDRFYIASAAVPDVPVEVFDFTKGEDKVLISGIPEVKKFSDIKLEQVGLDTSIKVNINSALKEFGILRNIQANTLTPDDFDYIVATFSITNASATEGNAITFTINRAEDTQAEQSVTVSTSLTAEDTASSTDFTAKTETITFESGETQKSFTVQTTPDFLFEENETFTVSLSNPTNEAIVNFNSGTAKGTINDDDDDPDPVVTITQTGDSTNVTEGGTDDSYSLVLGSQPSADVTITISSGKQIKTSTQALTFTALNWNVAQNVTVTAVDDVVIEGDDSETIQHTATSSDANYDGIAIASVNVGITDNDIPLSKSADSDVFTVKGNGDKARLSVELTDPSSNQLYELGVFTVDNQQGNIGDIAPGATGYAEAAVQRAKVIFSSLANIPNGFNRNLTSLVQFTSGEQIRFYVVSNSTTDSILARQTAITDILFSDPINLKIDSLSDGSFSLAWNGQNFKVKIQAFKNC
ncbi:Calx-beta domain-containing protein [Nostoc sp. CHAB 5715]|uniref:Calx-beta domain-containing protein n=1 Tax=Nostoc sp. CHAB 5715 TaxID=2780400 RepID=UPI001E5206C2|nr:Calx-beta domain-containing protein [Nostoc sp. CHAB 5715]MCC5620913.1 sodium:calcium exchanger [Nostoc sp. CHAB 5715]